MRTEEQKAARRAYRKLPHVREAENNRLRKKREANRELERGKARERYARNIKKERVRARSKTKAHPEALRAIRQRYNLKHADTRRKYQQARYKAFREALDTVKLNKGCADCGYKGHPAALDFDHVRGTKRLSISSAGSISSAIKEAEKCDVRCANCHRIATFQRGQYRKKPTA